MGLFEDNSGYCGNCKKLTAFESTASYRVWPYSKETKVGINPNKHVGEVGEVKVLTCLYCKESTATFTHHVFKPGVRGSEVLSEEVIYPRRPPRTLDETVPSDVRSFFTEASICESAGAMRGAGVLYRAAVEAIAAQQNAAGATLFEQIESLKDGPAAQVVADMHEARLLGNGSIHDGITYAAEEVADVADLIEEACHLLYVQPAERTKLREARKARKDAARVLAKQEPAALEPGSS